MTGTPPGQLPEVLEAHMTHQRCSTVLPEIPQNPTHPAEPVVRADTPAVGDSPPEAHSTLHRVPLLTP